jgi:hypothetical protein
MRNQEACTSGNPARIVLHATHGQRTWHGDMALGMTRAREKASRYLAPTSGMQHFTAISI